MKDVDRCNEEGCEECCDHEFDPGEGNYCLNCGLLKGEKPFRCLDQETDTRA